MDGASLYGSRLYVRAYTGSSPQLLSFFFVAISLSSFLLFFDCFPFLSSFPCFARDVFVYDSIGIIAALYSTLLSHHLNMISNVFFYSRLSISSLFS